MRKPSYSPPMLEFFSWQEKDVLTLSNPETDGSPMDADFNDFVWE